MIHEERLVEILDEVLNKHRTIDNDRHTVHHQFIEMQIAKAEHRTEVWNSVRASVYGWLIISALSGLGWIGVKVWRMVGGGSN